MCEICDLKAAVIRWYKWRQGQHDWPKGASKEELELADSAEDLLAELEGD